MERSCRQQVHIDAPVEAIWDLLGDPNRHPEWWPDMVEMECTDITEGCRYRGVVKGPLGRPEEHELVLDTLDECREVSIFCDGTGVTTRFSLAEAQGGTFVDGYFAVEPKSVGGKVFASVAGRAVLRSWLKRSLAALKQATERPAA